MKKKWPEALRCRLTACCVIVNPKGHWDLNQDELKEYGVDALKLILRWYGRMVQLNGVTIRGLVDAKLTLNEYKLLKPKLLRTSYHFRNMDKIKDTCKRMHGFGSRLSPTPNIHQHSSMEERW